MGFGEEARLTKMWQPHGSGGGGGGVCDGGGGRAGGFKGGFPLRSYFLPVSTGIPPTRIHRSVRGDIKRTEMRIFPRPPQRIG